MRQLGDHARAADAYAVAERLGAAADNVYAVLMAQLGRAKLTVERGNLPAAEAACDAVIDAATRAGVLDVRAQACYERAHVAHRRGHYALAVSLAYEAWTETTDPAERDRVLTGLATSLADVGQREAARDANLLLAAQARDPSTRWVATINLLELAAQDGREVEFTRLRRALEDVDLPPMLAGHFHYYVAQGYQTFGQPARAGAEYDRAIAIATRHGLNELLMQAEGARGAAAARTAVPVPPCRAAPTPPNDRAVNSVAAAIRGARQLAGITG
jgi:tetratricopeptide (TPR) repeat protein